MSEVYPVHLFLEGRLCVVLGGGPVAERRALGLLEAGAKVRVAALDATPVLQALAERGEIELCFGGWKPEYLEGAFLLFTASSSLEANTEAARAARERSIPVNRADVQEEGDFAVPAVVRRGALTFSVATGGGQPLLTSQIARELEEQYGKEYGPLIALLGRLRQAAKENVPAPELRRALLAEAVGHRFEMLDALKSGADVELIADEVIRRLLEAARRGSQESAVDTGRTEPS